MEEYKLFVQRIGLVGITNILITLGSFILLPIVTKNFSIVDYGFWVQINTIISLIPVFASLGLPYAMVIFLSAEKDKSKIQEGFYSIASFVLISSLIISSLLFIFSKNIASALFNGSINITILLSIIVFLACLNGLLINFFRTFNQMKRYSVFLLIQTYLGIFIISYFVINGFGIYMAELGLLIANIVTFLIMISFIISNIGFKIPKFKKIREYLSFAIPTVPSNLSFWVVDSSDRFVIGIMLSAAFVGYYSPGYTLGNIVIMILAPFSLLLPSTLPKYYEQGNIEKINLFLKYSLKYYLLIAIPAAFGLSALSKPLLVILTNPEIATNGYLITPFVAFGALLFGVYGIISNVLILEKKTSILGMIWIGVAILNLVLNIILVPFLGIIGAATVTLIAYIIAFTLTHLYSVKYIKLDYDLSFIFKSVTASLIISAIIILINPYGIFNVLITVIICSLVYFVLLTILKGIKKEEIIFFKEILKNS